MNLRFEMKLVAFNIHEKKDAITLYSTINYPVNATKDTVTEHANTFCSQFLSNLHFHVGSL